MCVSVGHFPLELNNMGLEERHTGQAVSTEQVLGIGQAPRDSQLLVKEFSNSYLSAVLILLRLLPLFLSTL